MGEGHLDRWEQHWNLLPFVLASTWDKMEYSAARRMEHISQLEADLQRMETPVAGWKETLNGISHRLDGKEDHFFRKIIMAEIGAKARTLETEQKLIIALDSTAEGEYLQMAGAWHQALQNRYPGTPSTVFMGGSMENAFIVFFNRPLVADDFVDLWSV